MTKPELKISDSVKINTDMYAVHHFCPNCGVGMFHGTKECDSWVDYSCPSCGMPMSLNYKLEDVRTIGEWFEQLGL